jgi:hypothetical protein
LAGFGGISNGGGIQTEVFGEVNTKNGAGIFATDFNEKQV